MSAEALIHLYCGDGKGKTTAAVGLTVRAVGVGKRVLFAQFLKNGNSAELSVLRDLPGVEICVCPRSYGFFARMSEEEKRSAARDYGELLASVLQKARSGFELLVLDEAVGAAGHQLIDERILIDFLRGKPPELEVVLTGREPSEDLLEQADYVTMMQKVKHPYDQGIRARKGIEF